jgi:hypothetical protein
LALRIAPNKHKSQSETWGSQQQGMSEANFYFLAWNANFAYPLQCNAKHPSKPAGSRNTDLAGAVRVQTRGRVLERAKAAAAGRITDADQAVLSMA